MRPKLFGDADADRNGCGRNLVGFPNRLVWFQERKAVLEFNIEGIFPIEVTGVFNRRMGSLPKRLLHSGDGFHNRPSFLSSSITLTSFRLGIQPSIPRMRTTSRHPIKRSLVS